MKGTFRLKWSARCDSPQKSFQLWLLAVCFVGVAAAAGQDNYGQVKPASSGSWSGVLVSSACNADEAFNESSECTKNVPGAKFALYDDTTRVMYSLEPQAAVAGQLGDAVTIRGTLEGDTIQIAAIGSMSIGLAVGQKAPPFSVRDQFGRIQTLDGLKGANGTVLLFFRSADW
jgi:hypothetical protein